VTEITIYLSDAARNRETDLDPAHFETIARAGHRLIHVAGTGGNFNHPFAAVPRQARRPIGEHRERVVMSRPVR
jgi:hypothetical protein